MEGLLNVWITNDNNAIEGTIQDWEKNIRGIAGVAELTREELDPSIAKQPVRELSG